MKKKGMTLPHEIIVGGRLEPPRVDALLKAPIKIDEALPCLLTVSHWLHEAAAATTTEGLQTCL
jgi:hypothetical protein